MPSLINITGQRFGKLVAVKRTNKVVNNCKLWKFRCDCGKYTFVAAAYAKNRNTRSCGCLRQANTRKMFTTHGASNTKEYVSWRAMKDRVNRLQRYSHIKICNRWKNFKNFLEDMGRIPKGKISIDRINNKRGYNPKNCRWATDEQQGRNKNNSIYLKYKGQKLHIAEWAARLRMNRSTLRDRIRESKWSIKKALTTPVKARKVLAA